MPIYAYRCSDCGFEKDYLQRLSDPMLSDCPQCGKATLIKQLTAAGFQLKGSGWYATDFKNGAKPAINDADKGESAKPESNKSEAQKSDMPKSNTAKPDSAKSVSEKSQSDKPESSKSEAAKADSKSAASNSTPAANPR